MENSIASYAASIEALLAALEATPIPDERALVVGLSDASMILVIHGNGYRLGSYPVADQLSRAFASADAASVEQVRRRLAREFRAAGTRDRATVHTARAARLAAIECAQASLAVLRSAPQA